MENEFERAIRETIERQEASKPEFNNKECRKGCNCADIAMGGELNFDLIKKGYPCLMPQNDVTEKQTPDADLEHKIQALKNLFNGK